MTILLTNVLALLFWAKVLRPHRDEGPGKKLFVLIASAQWVILSGFRSLSIGADTRAYEVMYETASTWTPGEVLQEFVDYPGGRTRPRDYGYELLQAVLSGAGVPYRGFLILVAVVFTGALGFWIYKFSCDVVMSFVIYSTLFSTFFAFTGIRQTLAVAVAYLLGYGLLTSRRRLAYAAVLLVGASLHRTALVLLVLPVLGVLPMSAPLVAAAVAASAVAWAGRNAFMEWFADASGYGDYAQQFAGAGTVKFTVLLFLLTLVIALRADRLPLDEPRVRFAALSLLVSWVLIPLTFVEPTAMRIVQYFSMSLLILVPEVIRTFDAKDRHLINYVAIAALLLLYAQTGIDYAFM